MRGPLVLLFGLLVACGDSEATSSASPDASSEVTAADVVGADLGEEDVVEVVDPQRAAIPEPTERLFAGVAEVDLGFPVGSATVGYAPGKGANSPYAMTFPGTNAQHTKLTAKTLVFRNQGHALVIVRTDTIGIWQDIVIDVQRRLRELGRADLAKGLIIAASHTHLSGGHIFDHPVGEFAVGPFIPGFYMRVRDAMVNSILEADSAAVPARVGSTTVQVPDFHNDRRCQNGPVQDDSLGLIRVEDDGGVLMAAVVNYSMHGTILDAGWVLSSDAPGAVEHGIERALSEHAPVLFLQSWAGDMAPNVPDGYVVNDEAPEYHEGLADLDVIAAAAGNIIAPYIASIQTEPDAAIRVASERFPLDGKTINPDGSFDAYPMGGIWCVPDEGDASCEEGFEPYTSDDLACLPFNEDLTVTWGQITAARIGDFGLVTLPGEPCTSVGVSMRDAAIASTGLEQVFVVGYAQGYLSYLLDPHDYWMGGYEATSALMGPNFGPYLVDVGSEIARRVIEPEAALSFDVIADEDTEGALSYGPLEVPKHAGQPGFVEELSIDEERVLSARWVGGPPAADMPVVTLEQAVEGAWEPVLRKNGAPVNSRGPEMVLRLEPDPPYGEGSDARTYYWVLWLGLDRVAESDVDELTGSVRIRVEGMADEGYSLTSSSVEL